MSYPGTDVFIVCFSVVGRDSFKNVEQKWINEIQHHCPGQPVVVCGTKLDLRDEPVHKANNPVTKEEGEALAQRIGAKCYLECSARTRDGLKPVFEAAVRTALSTVEEQKQSVRKKHKCAIL